MKNFLPCPTLQFDLEIKTKRCEVILSLIYLKDIQYLVTYIYFDILCEWTCNSHFLPVAISFVNSLCSRHKIFCECCIAVKKLWVYFRSN